MSEPAFPARIIAIRYEATDVLSFVLKPIDPARISPVDPGSHIDVHLPNGMDRSYSLSNNSGDERSYRLTVARDLKSRGGSTYMHDGMRVGQIVNISGPRNNFVLAEDAPLTVFVAGGIGVTPFIPMMVRLNVCSRKWRIHYSVRTRDRAALLQEIEQLAAVGHGEVLPNFDGEPDGVMLDLKALIAGVPAGTHLYCCGPTGMLNAFREGCDSASIDSARIHFEYFQSEAVSATEGGFVVVLQKSGKSVTVAPGQTILQALTSIGVTVPFSCMEGMCGACETRIVAGIADHRDMILSDRERADNKSMMVCCSGSKSPTLTLDL